MGCFCCLNVFNWWNGWYFHVMLHLHTDNFQWMETQSHGWYGTQETVQTNERSAKQHRCVSTKLVSSSNSICYFSNHFHYHYLSHDSKQVLGPKNNLGKLSYSLTVFMRGLTFANDKASPRLARASPFLMVFTSVPSSAPNTDELSWNATSKAT